MTDYYTQFSCELDVGTPANVIRALEILEDDALYDDPDDLLSDGFTVSIDETNGATLWIYDDGIGAVERVIAFVLLCAEAFNLTGLWGFKYANTCSRPILDSFGGGAHAIDLTARKSIGWISANVWLESILAGADPNASLGGSVEEMEDLT